MNSQEFREWRIRIGVTQARAAKMLATGLRSIKHYEGGTRPIPNTVALLTRYVESYGPLEELSTKIPD